jgi:Protein of unknown function (DUF2281)
VKAILVGELPQLGKEAKFMTIKQIIQSKIDILPESKQAELLNFMNFLIESQSESNSQQNVSLQSPPKRQRVLGLNKGEISMSDDFNAPLPDEFWLGEE